jgi:hypothetical protein
MTRISTISLLGKTMKFLVRTIFSRLGSWEIFNCSLGMGKVVREAKMSFNVEMILSS